MAVTEAPPRAPTLPAAPAREVPALALAAVEARAALRSPAFRLLLLLALIVGWTAGSASGQGFGLGAWAAGDAAWRYLGLVVIVWMSLAAVQDTAQRMDALVYSKPQPTERLVLARFAALFAQVLAALAALYAASMLSGLVAGARLGGAYVYLPRFVVSAGLLFFAAAASYTLALLARTPLAGIVVALGWVLTLAGKGFLAKAYFPAYTQNVPTYVLLGGSLLCLACWTYRRQRRGARRPALWCRALAPLLLLLSGVTLWRNLASDYEPYTRTFPALDLMASQDLVEGERAPGFRLPDQRGQLASLADYPDHILVVALWSPNDPDSVPALAKLEAIARKYRGRRVQPIAVCLSEDTAAAATFGLGDQLDYPVVQDLGTHNSPSLESSAPLATAYRATSIPRIVITDRRRRARTILSGEDSVGGAGLDAAIDARLAAEPE